MKKFKLIKEYPNSPKIGCEVTFENGATKYDVKYLDGHSIIPEVQFCEKFTENWKKTSALFKTEDGVLIYLKDPYFVVNTETNDIASRVGSGQEIFSDKFIRFKYSDYAQRFIESNSYLFKTEDGVKIRKQDSFYYVILDKMEYHLTYGSAVKQILNPAVKRFSTEELAKKFINANKVLFTTEDGIKIKEGMSIWYVLPGLQIKPFKVLGNMECADNIKYFSNTTAANEYVYLNTKCYSLQDVLNCKHDKRNTSDKYLVIDINKLKNGSK